MTGYIANDPPFAIGEADLVAPASDTSVWLVVDGKPTNCRRGCSCQRVRILAIKGVQLPPHLQVVGAAADGLVAVRGGFRARRLILWDPQLEEQIRDLGWVIAVREVLDRYALVTTGCLTSGCTTAMVDVVTGNSTDVDIPLGWREVGEPRLIPEVDGVAVVVADMSGQTALAIGAPDDLQVVAELAPGTGMQALPGPGGWLLVPLADGDVAAWREDLGDTEVPQGRTVGR